MKKDDKERDYYMISMTAIVMLVMAITVFTLTLTGILIYLLATGKF